MKTAQATSNLKTSEDLRQIIIAGKGDKTLTAYAAKLGVSFQYLGKVLSGEYSVGTTIAKALGFEQVTLFIPIKKAAGASKTKAKAKK